MAGTDTNVRSQVNTIVDIKPCTIVVMSTFGDRVRAERIAQGLSYQELADRVSIAAGVKCPRVTITKIEDRASEASKWSPAIAAALKVDHDWLLTGKGQKNIAASIDKRLKRLERIKPDAVERLHRQINVLIDDEESSQLH
ncbi:helix-turn-helix domain-containing protein [Mesorhizobium sp. M1334]|uniref:helix-turn-helix domain-containing protein n=1 Tax=Mesorhizobium sp. M1334 TaxID=2957084 RepID=UPI003336D5C0